MRRKLIKQGEKSTTLTVPAKWLHSQKLRAGDEIDIYEDQTKLILVPPNIKKRKEITISLPKIKQKRKDMGFVNDSIIIAYTAGFDKIIINHEEKPEIISNLVDERLTGMEIITLTPKTCILESVSDPNYQDFDKIILRLFYIIKDMIQDFSNPLMHRHKNTLLKYRLFLQRSISKRIFNHDAEQFYTQFFYFLSEAGKMSSMLNTLIKQKKVPLPKSNDKIIQYMKELTEVMQQAYLHSDYLLLHPLQQKGQTLLYTDLEKHFKGKDLLLHIHLLQIYKPLYQATSQLFGILLMRNTKAW